MQVKKLKLDPRYTGASEAALNAKQIAADLIARKITQAEAEQTLASLIDITMHNRYYMRDLTVELLSQIKADMKQIMDAFVNEVIHAKLDNIDNFLAARIDANNKVITYEYNPADFPQHRG